MIASVYRNIRNPVPIANAYIKDLLLKIKDNDAKSIILELRNNLEDKKEYKQKLPVITWAGVFSYRSKSNLIQFSNHIYIDIDGGFIDKQKIAEISFVRSVWLSCSATGLGVLIECSGLNKRNFESTFRALQKEFSKFKIPDSLPDYSRANYLSYDPEIIIKTEYELFQAVEPEFKEIKVKVGETTQSVEEAGNAILFYLNQKLNIYFVQGQRDIFTLRFARAACKAGLTEAEAFSFLQSIGMYSNHTYNKIIDFYKRLK
jgi:hypothetical protein